MQAGKQSVAATDCGEEAQIALVSCHSFRNNAVRLQLHALAYNLANFLQTLALQKAAEQRPGARSIGR